MRRSFRFDGGAEVAANSFINALSELGELQLICEAWSGDLLNRIELHELGVQGYTRAKRYSNFISRALMLTSSQNAITHSHEWTPGVDVLRLGDGLHSQWLDIREMPTVWRMLDGFHRQKLRLEKEAISHPNLKSLICNSDFIKNSILQRYEIEPAKIQIIRNIVTSKYKTFDPLGVQRLNNKLLFVGSGWERKGLSKAIMAFALLPKDWSLDVVGSDKAIIRYRKLASELKCADRINFLGAFPATPELYAKATVLIHPAMYEPFPNVAIEALSQGLPVVSSINSGTSDFSKAEGVWTVEGDEHSLAESVLSAAKSSSENRAAFRAHILQFDEEYLQKELKAIYSNIMST